MSSGDVKPVPEGFHTVTPYLSVKGGAAALAFYEKAFGAHERFRMPGSAPGSIGHAEFVIGDSILMLADESPYGKSPTTLGGVCVSICLYVDDVDAWFKRAVEAGAAVIRELRDEFYGDRTGSVQDPFGHQWHLMTHKRDVSVEEMQQAAEKMAAAAAKPSDTTPAETKADVPPVSSPS
jgi:PhnB protein